MNCEKSILSGACCYILNEVPFDRYQIWDIEGLARRNHVRPSGPHDRRAGTSPLFLMNQFLAAFSEIHKYKRQCPSDSECAIRLILNAVYYSSSTIKDERGVISPC